MDQILKEKILSQTEEIDGKQKLPCKKAFKLAAELNISKQELGQACNELGVKIYACQLGCF